MGDLVDQGALAISDGYRVRNEELGPTGIPFVRGGDIRQGWINTDTDDHIRPELAHRVSRKLSKPGDAAFITKGTVGRTGRLRPGQPPVVFAPQVAYWRVLDRSVLDPGFIFYLMQSHPFQSALDGVKTHGAMAADYVSISQQHDFRFRFPDVKEQQAIAHILGTLDDKIELNRRMSDTLEAMARALFKSWFVDFDPVRAKAEGRDPGLPKHLADLFPDRLVDSELGEIPEGWEVVTIRSIADVIYGAPFRSARFNDDGVGMPLLRIRDLGNHEPGIWTPEEHPRGYLVKPGDLVVGMDGEFRAHLWHGPKAWLNQRVCCFKPKEGVPRAFVHYSIEAPLASFERSKTGTTVIHLGKRDIDSFRVLKPTAPALAAFSDIAEATDSRIVAGAYEARTLTTLRDTLLPKLVSGELRLQDPDRFLERATA